MAEEKITNVKEKVDEIMETKPKPVEVEKTEKVDTKEAPSMIEEARQLKEDLSIIRDEIKIEREKLDAIHSQAILGGKSLGPPQEKTKEESAKQNATDILETYYGK